MSVLLAIAIVIAQGAAGTIWWWALRSRGSVSWAESAGMGLALGTVASLITGVVLRPVMGPWGWSVPVVITAVIASLRAPWLKAQIRRTELPPSHAVAIVVGSIAGLVIIIGNWMRVPLDAVSDSSYADIYFLEALSRGVTHWGPGHSILMDGGQLPYHWFTYGWIGQLAASAGTESFFALTRVLPVVAAIGMVLLAIAWTQLLGTRQPRWVPSLAAVLVVFAGYPGALYGSILNFDSPSQSLTTVWLLAFGFAVIVFLHGARSLLLIAVGLLAVALVGGKVSHAAVAAAGVVLLAVVGAFTRAPWRVRAGIVLIVTGVAMGITFLLVLRGAALEENITETLAVKASTWQGLDPLVGRWGPVLGTIALALAVSARPAGLALLVGQRRWRADPAVIFALGGFIAGLGALLVLREGVNETWFVLAASAPAGALSAVGVGVGLAWLRRQGLARPLGVAVALAVPVSVLVLILTWNWPIDPNSPAPRVLPWLAAVAPWLLAPLVSWWLVRWKAPQVSTVWKPVATLSVGVIVLTSIVTRPAAAWTALRPVTTETGVLQPTAGNASVPPSPTVVSMDQDRSNGASWLKDNASDEAIVATTNTGSAFLPAVTGLRTYLSGAAYQAGLGASGSRPEVERRSAIASALTSDDWESVTPELCDAGVDYYWIEGAAPIRDVVAADFDSENVVILSRSALC